MTRFVNKVQNEIMLNKMQNNRAIACNFVKTPKDLLDEFWNSLTEELNSAGPPIKHVSEWKKVWLDQKRYVRSKAATNMKNQCETGGGPNQTKLLSANEQCIYDLIGMKESVEGLANSSKFGLPDGCDVTTNASKPETPLGEEDTETPGCSKQATPPLRDVNINMESCKKTPYSTKWKRTEPQEKLTTSELIAKELMTQENLCSKMEDICESMTTHSKEIITSVKRVYRALEKGNELKAKKLKIKEQHYAEMQSKIEKNNKLIAIEELKLQLLQKNN